ncbi:hypothetical protein BV25DRAFT_1959929 [Artomyces pyxidatus]|uniref:Uncharacterized protein n=1 Tax=Artomyces pyxidatus TaxID=48021 RepID=A0ACB8TFT6_9AGAM|nr:hypothetical protein BV25DRAFT_1959929 [Artomyces pyxidatus]
MSNSSKPLNLARLNDLLLGAFARAAPSETLDHLIRYLSTWSGSDKLFMIIQYAAKLLVPFLQLRARLQHKAGSRTEPISRVAHSLEKLSGLVGSARELWGLWCMLPIVQWLISLERSPPPTRRLLTIERTQGWSMLAFYPLQNLYYLRSRDIIPASLPIPAPPIFTRSKAPLTIPIDSTSLSLWSTRLWALYVCLQLAHLREDRALLIRRQRALGRDKVRLQQDDLRRRWDAWYNELAVNLAYLPMTIHWSLEKGAFKNDIWVSAFGLAAALASFRSGWKATAPPPTSVAPPESLITTEEDKVLPGVLDGEKVQAAVGGVDDTMFNE